MCSFTIAVCLRVPRVSYSCGICQIKGLQWTASQVDGFHIHAALQGLAWLGGQADSVTCVMLRPLHLNLSVARLNALQ